MTAFTYLIAGFITKYAGKKKIALRLSILGLIVNLVFFKYFNQLANLFQKFYSDFYVCAELKIPYVILPVGLSYITFRLIHYLVETYRNRIFRCSFVDFALYVMFFSLFPAGPVERFQNFYAQTINQHRFEMPEINYGLLRILIGIGKKIFLADNLKRILTPIVLSPQTYNSQILILSLYGLAIQVYMDFSGYSDIAIGSARLFGYKIIENFRSPFLKPNIALFWRSWHISVYSWIRDYFFLPLFGHRASTFRLYLGILASFIVFHLWHKGNISFLVLGIYHGTGLIVWSVFQELKKKSYFFKRELFRYGFWKILSTFLTFSFASFGFIFFVADIDKAFIFIRAIFH